MLALAPVAVLLLIAIHESGHALAALALGATIREFQVDLLAGKPHVSHTSLGNGPEAIVLAAGPGLTLLVWLVWLAAAGERGSVWHRKMLLIGGVGALFPLLTWTVLPVLHANGYRVRDDCVSFERLTGISPYLLSFVAFLLLLAGLWLVTRRSNVWATIRAPLTPIVSRRFHVVLCAALLLAALLFASSALPVRLSP